MDILLITIINTIVGAITTALIVYFLTTKKIDKVADLLHRFIQHFNKSFPDVLFDSHSPLKLKERGYKTIKASGIDVYIDEHINEYVNEFKDMREVLIYEKCQEIAESTLKETTPKIMDIREYFYTEGISDSDMRTVFALYLRDAVLKEQKMERVKT